MSDTTTIEAFTFGDPIPVLDQRELAGCFHSAFNGSWYEPPVSFDGLARALPANSHHRSAIEVKVNILASCFKPHRLLTRHNFKRLAFDFLVFGNAYVEQRNNRLGGKLSLDPLLARWTRVRKNDDLVMLIEGQEIEFPAERVLHILEPDISQEIYGLPGYIAAMQSALLNEAATLFRRKYYVNGSHAGFILYMTDAADNQEDIDGIRKALKDAKGPGNFRNMFVYAPNGKKEGLQLIPISEVTAKDEFLNMKNVTRDDVLAAHRVPPQLMGIIPNNTGGFGNVGDAAKVFARNELVPLESTFTAINDWIGEEVVAFDAYVIEGEG